MCNSFKIFTDFSGIIYRNWCMREISIPQFGTTHDVTTQIITSKGTQAVGYFLSVREVSRS